MLFFSFQKKVLCCGPQSHGIPSGHVGCGAEPWPQTLWGRSEPSHETHFYVSLLLQSDFTGVVLLFEANAFIGNHMDFKSLTFNE